MPGFVITSNTGLKCLHSPGPTPDITYSRVKVQGQPIVLQGYPYTIKTCTQPPQTMCKSGSWTVGAQRVRAGGTPVAISTGVSVLMPPGAFTVLLVQSRVKAS